MQLLTNVLMSNSDLQQNILCIFWIHTIHYSDYTDLLMLTTHPTSQRAGDVSTHHVMSLGFSSRGR